MKEIEQPAPRVDEVIAEVHRHKRAITAEHGDDVESLLRNLQERQQGSPSLVKSTGTNKSGEQAQ